jgi:hypothetical protein
MLAALFDKTALAPNPGVGTSPSAVIPAKAGGGGAGGEGTAPALPSGQSPPELTPGITIPELPA